MTTMIATMIEAACQYRKPVRIGVNWGSLDQQLLARMMDENAARAEPWDADEHQVKLGEALAGRAAAAPLAGWTGALAAANLRGFRRDPGTASGTVRLVGLPAPGPDAPPALNYAWATFPAPPGGWDLSRRTVLGATVTNRGAVVFSGQPVF